MTRDEAYQLAQKYDSRVSAAPEPIVAPFMVDSEAIRDRLSGAHLFIIDHGGCWVGGEEYVGITDPEGEIFTFIVGE